MHGKVGWFEVMGTDAARSRAFYGAVFGWTFRTSTEYPEYGLVEGAEAPGGGVGQARGHAWATFYVEVDDLDQALATATSQGGRVLLPRTELGDMSLAVIADPDGLAVGLTSHHAT